MPAGLRRGALEGGGSRSVPLRLTIPCPPLATSPRAQGWASPPARNRRLLYPAPPAPSARLPLRWTRGRSWRRPFPGNGRVQLPPGVNPTAPGARHRSGKQETGGDKLHDGDRRAMCACACECRRGSPRRQGSQASFLFRRVWLTPPELPKLRSAGFGTRVIIFLDDLQRRCMEEHAMLWHDARTSGRVVTSGGACACFGVRQHRDAQSCSRAMLLAAVRLLSHLQRAFSREPEPLLASSRVCAMHALAQNHTLRTLPMTEPRCASAPTSINTHRPACMRSARPHAAAAACKAQYPMMA